MGREESNMTPVCWAEGEDIFIQKKMLIVVYKYVTQYGNQNLMFRRKIITTSCGSISTTLLKPLEFF